MEYIHGIRLCDSLERFNLQQKLRTAEDLAHNTAVSVGWEAGIQSNPLMTMAFSTVHCVI
jgi:hypothetical protein